MKNFKISLAGDLGSGKSTVGELLSRKYSFEKVSIGSILRQMAKEKGMDVNQFNKYMETHPEIDGILDTKLKNYENLEGKYLFDSRMAWHFVPSSFSVYMKCSPLTSAKRVLYAGRSTEAYGSIEDAVKQLSERRKSESFRYQTLYGVDISDMSNYNLVIETDDISPNEVSNIISTAFEKWLATKSER